MGKTETTWKPGQSGNPKGRPKGSRNKASIAADQLLDDEAEAITRKAIELAIAGDTTALRLCLERLCPPRKERPISIALPEMNSAADAVAAAGAILEAVASGDLTASEGQTLGSIIETYRRTIETEDIEKRIIELERSLK